LLGACLAYLLGSLPFGVWVARSRGVDIQRVGSGNTGATNVLRALGTEAAVFVLLLDAAKGFLGAALGHWAAGALGGGLALGAVVGGLAAFSGHNWSFLLGFKGGRGVATGAGAALFILPFEMALGVTTVVVVVFLTRYVSLGSILGAAVVAIAALLRPHGWESRVFAVLATTMIIYRHRPNIARLRNGTESRIGERVAPPGSGSGDRDGSGGGRGTRAAGAGRGESG